MIQGWETTRERPSGVAITPSSLSEVILEGKITPDQVLNAVLEIPSVAEMRGLGNFENPSAALSEKDLMLKARPPSRSLNPPINCRNSAGRRNLPLFSAYRKRDSDSARNHSSASVDAPVARLKSVAQAGSCSSVPSATPPASEF